MFSSPKSRSEPVRSQLTPTEFFDFENQTGRGQLEDPDVGDTQEQARGLSLFWRTFFLLALLLVGSILAWLQTLRSLEFEPRIQQTAQQLASQVNLSRAALVHADAIARISLLKTMRDQESLPLFLGNPAIW